jgi:hypothetical protein
VKNGEFDFASHSPSPTVGPQTSPASG